MAWASRQCLAGSLRLTLWKGLSRLPVSVAVSVGSTNNHSKSG
ncbi:hypothetical protein BOS5A_200297 [Bosea sp. EC-HK365B]|nr:hypothetical protein BOSE21B_100298 [Bosea sp. 21B]CAD5284483.1 hypothetical protein BOSE7B_41232 [Bosea sp. 7B]VVT57838.1 hypothetical protein BOS5A_200297 [Bosea sp. EC-HK365B]VXC91578.1 hypothetical protein BOSE127_80014 [Bosea sp. 127]